MRTLALASLALVGGCWYDRPNPWNTEGDVRRYQDKTEETWLLEMEQPWQPPQHAAARPLDPELEAWRDTVLGQASRASLEHMRGQSQKRIAFLQQRFAQVAVQEEIIRREDERMLRDQYRVEKTKLAMIDAKLGIEPR